MAKQGNDKSTTKTSGGISLMALLLVLTVPFAAALVVSIVFFSTRITATSAEDETLYMEKLYSISTELINADRDFYQAMQGAMERHDYADSAEPEQIQEYLTQYEENRQQVIDRVTDAVAVAQADPVLWTGTVLEAGGATFETLSGEYEEAFHTWETAYDPKNNIGDWKNYLATFEDARGYLSEMTDLVEKWAADEVVMQETATKRTILISAIIFVVIAAVLVFIALLIARRMSKNAKEITAGVREMSNGDFVKEIPSNSLVSEFKAIAVNSENMRQRLQNALLQVIGHAGDVDEAANSSKSKITNGQKMSSDISSAVEDLAQGATSLAQDVQSTSDLTNNIGNSVDLVLEAANGNLEKGRAVFDNSSKVQQQIEDLKIADQKTDEMAGEVAESVNETAAAVEEISNAAEAIMSIASQTNLLALNASIEAARAGEAGKGFAVVADNIKDLAEQSNQSAGQITEILSRITELSERNKELTGRIKEATTNESVSLQEMSASFDEMINLVQETEQGNQQIVSLVETMTSDKNAIMGSVEALSSVSEQSAASTEETSASLEQLNASLVDVVEQAENLQRIAEALEENVRFFHVQ
ncbi:MAG: hypothetical protein IJJ13_07780 [Lachnospiraceae bacterium]|nr:hypothetical protein [Lachnospiraceae bacterium]